MDRVDLCIIGAGPAGMTAAVTAAEHGLSVVLLDERASPGGQIYRGIDDGPLRSDGRLGADYAAGMTILQRFKAAAVDSKFGVNIWRVDMAEGGGALSFFKDGRSNRLHFSNLLLATGAMERPVPFEGWTLPGVMTVGAAQLLLKSSGIVPAGRVVLAGNGPLLLLFASQLISMGVTITAILDTAPKVGTAAVALQTWRALIGNRGKLAKGVQMMRQIRAAGIAWHRDVSQLAASGDDWLKAVSFTVGGRATTLDADMLLVHEGVLPNTQLSRALGCIHVWDEGQQCFRPDLDAYGESSVAGVFVVGDGASIDGALAAPATAEIAVCRMLDQMGRSDSRTTAIAARARAVFRREHRFRGFLEALYPPRIAAASCSDDTIVCRCEEVTAAQVRAAVRDGAIGPAQAKVFTRCGMGACQGRMCGPIVSQLIARETGAPATDVGAYNIRFPLKPLTLSDMASDVATNGGDEHAA